MSRHAFFLRHESKSISGTAGKCFRPTIINSNNDNFDDEKKIVMITITMIVLIRMIIRPKT